MDVVAVGLGQALGQLAVDGALEPHRLGLDPDQELVAELLLERVGDPLEVLARVGVEQLAGLGVVAVAVDPRDSLIPRQHGERVEVGDRCQLGFLGTEADVVAVAVGEQVGRGAVDELVAALGDLRKERRHDALAHHPARDRDLLEEHVLDPTLLDQMRQLCDLLGTPGGVASLLERRGWRHDPIAREHGRDGPPERRLGCERRVSGAVGCHTDLLSRDPELASVQIYTPV